MHGLSTTHKQIFPGTIRTGLLLPGVVWIGSVGLGVAAGVVHIGSVGLGVAAGVVQTG